ncbi:Nin one binding Zn-ribbon like-domain-containing protein [Pisolithus croceorrhizus]|nr:Nin one binding Zn-ribbon like-domain-containing protein [Pisolithus croceorrhizus]
MAEDNKRCKYLVLDSGPLLSLSPLRGLADTYLTVPQVLDELKDKRAREHFEQLGLSAGVQVSVRNPAAASLSQVIQYAKKTGDYAVLSHADICVLALTHTLHEQEKALQQNQREVTPNEGAISSVEPPSEGSKDYSSTSPPAQPVETSESSEINEQVLSPVPSHVSQNDFPDASHPVGASGDVEDRVEGEGSVSPPPSSGDESASSDNGPLYDDPSSEDDDDDEGEWITPGNVELHKARALHLLPSEEKGKKDIGNAIPKQPSAVGCMTADFAMQNVLLQMGLHLMSTDGRRIQKIKSWVLRCHACFKICKDNSKQFCPSCGNPTLMRTSVTVSSPDASADAPVMQVHLKKNFQYRVRGTRYSIPAPKPGSAKTGTGEGLILREDQIEYMRAKKRAEGKRERDEQRMIKGLVESGGKSGVAVGSWADPDWIPDILSGTRNKSRSTQSGHPDGMPRIGYGRKNPNEGKRRKKK